MELRSTLASCLLLGGTSLAPICCAEQITLMVTVTDHNGVPLHGAGVAAGWSVCERPLARSSTNVDGVAALTFDAPDELPRRGRLLVTQGKQEEETDKDAILRWRRLGHKLQFSSLGMPFDLPIGQNQVAVTVQGLATVPLFGQARLGPNPVMVLATSVSGEPTPGAEADESGAFEVKVPRDFAVVSLLGDHWEVILAPSVPVGAVSVDLGVVQMGATTGRVAGLATSGGLPAKNQGMTLVRLGGGVMREIGTDSKGFFDDDFSDPGFDPAVPDQGIELPAGEYVIMVGPPDMWISRAAAFRELAIAGGGIAEFQKLPRFTIHGGQRTNISLDLDQVRDLTKAALEEML